MVSADVPSLERRIAELEAERDRLQAELERIANTTASGPHPSAADGMSSALAALDRCRDIARAALREEPSDG